MSTKTLGMVASLAELQAFYKGDTANIIELMSQTNDILDDVKFMESNMSDGHLTKIRTSLPEIYWRRLYRGTPYSKGQYSQVKEACSMMEARALVDKKEADLFSDRVKQFRESEARGFVEAMRQKAAHTLFYGDSNKNVDEFNGLSMRYPTKASPFVVDAGGTGDVTSAWLVCWGENTCHGIYPKGSMGGLQREDLGKQTVNDDDGRPYEALVEVFNWTLGLAVRDWRSVVRVANIPVANLTKRKGETGFIDLQSLFIQAKNMMPENMRQKAIWYGNSDVMTGAELQSTDAGNLHLVYGEAFKSDGMPLLFGRPLRQCDVISSKETVLK